MNLVFASNNEHKLQEIKDLLSDKWNIVTLRDVGIFGDIDETADTLEGNSLQKAQYVFNHAHQCCFADDTGLEIEALGNQPGVLTARFAGEHNNSAANRAKVLKLMQNETNRKAQFRTVITLILGDEIVQFEGVAVGQIATEEMGERGFGYDCIFIPEGYTKTFAQLSAEEKNSISHRGKAIRQMVEYLNNKYETLK